MSPRYARQVMSSKEAKALGRFIRTQREAKGLSLSQLEGAVGVDKSTVQRMEHGKIEAPSPATLQRLARALDVDFEDLFALAGYTTPEGLPALPVYLRAKYEGLTDADVARAERYIARIKKTPKRKGGTDAKSDR